MFCSNCGKEATGKFCSNCGAPLDVSAEANTTTNAQTSSDSMQEITLWEGQPDSLMDKAKTAAKVNTTYYTITNQRVIVKSGLIGKKQEEIELYKIQDYKVSQSISERLLNIGDLTIISSDSSAPTIVLNNIKNPNDVKEMLRKAILDRKKEMNVTYRDIM